MTRASMEGKGARGFLGALLDPLITFPENGAEGDDHLVAESNRKSYQTTDSIGSQVVLTSSEVDFGVHKDGSSYGTRHAQAPPPAPLGGWEMRMVDRKVPSDGNSIGLFSFSSDLTDNVSIVPDTPDPSLSNMDEFQFSGSACSDRYAHQEAWHDRSIQACSSLPTGGEGTFDVPVGRFDYDAIGASCPGAIPVGGCWPCDVVPQTKVGLQGCSMEVDAPYIAVPNHAPDFYEFDQ